MLTDSHCHLNFPDFRGRIDAVLDEMAQSGVVRAICISTQLETFDDVYGLATAHASLWATVGVHPDEEQVLEPTLDDLVSRAALPRVVGIGETGLDYYRLGERSVGDLQWQRDRFEVHIRAARCTGLPLVIHTRAASHDTLQMLQRFGGHGNGEDVSPHLAPATGVFHCFTESREVARSALDMGYMISFSGILTFRNAADLRDVASFVPMDRLLVETDSPYLAPVPHRGKTNTPAYVRHVAELLSEIKGVSLERMAQATTENTDRLFKRLASTSPCVPQAVSA
jgi:TatD DNase family protein